MVVSRACREHTQLQRPPPDGASSHRHARTALFGTPGRGGTRGDAHTLLHSGLKPSSATQPQGTPQADRAPTFDAGHSHA